MSRQSVLVFGSSGAIGASIANWFDNNHFNVFAASRKKSNYEKDGVTSIEFNPENSIESFKGIKENSINSIVWAQGANLSDNIYNLDIQAHRNLYDANVTFILISLQLLLKKNLLAPNARLCVISSIWQNIARQDKLSYCITKSALQGLVQSLAIDLGESGCLVNAVLPGALDTPMTRANLDEAQIRKLELNTPLKTLSTLNDVVNLVGFLCSDNNTGITGQFIAADRGFSYARIL